MKNAGPILGPALLCGILFAAEGGALGFSFGIGFVAAFAFDADAVGAAFSVGVVNAVTGVTADVGLRIRAVIANGVLCGGLALFLEGGTAGLLTAAGTGTLYLDIGAAAAVVSIASARGYITGKFGHF